MHWRFDPLFSIKIVHSKNVSVSAEDFSLEPTHATARLMKTLNWIHRAQAGFCTVYGEKVFDADGNTSFRVQPKAEESLAFFLRLNNASLLNETKPYVLASTPEIVPNVLPTFSGRTRLLYFDNLNPVPVSGGEFSLSTSAEVDLDQLASSAPLSFSFDKAKTGVSNLKFTALTPEAVTTQFALHPQLRSAQIDLPENAYRVEQIPGGPTETLVLMAENISGNELGVIRIFPGATGWEPLRRYRIDFQKV